MTATPSYTSFDGHRRLVTGSLQANALAIHAALASPSGAPVLLFDNATGRTLDIDVRGTTEAVAARYAETADAQETADEIAVPKGRGRPRLGVTAREVTLLPRHWEWLATQPGGTSVALRKLVEEARRVSTDKDRLRQACDRTYHFMLAIAGDLPGFEEATRALFAHDTDRVRTLIADWPADILGHALLLAEAGA